MNKKELTEADICTKFITPAIIGLNGDKWHVMTQLQEERYITKGRVIDRGKTVTRGEARKVDYLLFYKPNIPIAVVEAKDNNHSVGAAIARGENRILLVMATGTGKTYTAFQIIWRLWKSGVRKRILFLVDRNKRCDPRRGDILLGRIGTRFGGQRSLNRLTTFHDRRLPKEIQIIFMYVLILFSPLFQ